MRQLHVMFFAASAMAASAASAAGDQSSRWIRIQQLPLAGTMNQPAQADAAGKWIEIQGWDWEVEAETGMNLPVGHFSSSIAQITPHYDAGSANKADSFTMKQGHKNTRPVGTSDMTMKRGTSPAGSRPPPAPPDLDLDYDEGDTGTHAARRPAPSDKYGRVKVRFAWDGCARGTRLPLVELRDAGTLYRLEDATVAGCGNGVATFNYARLRKSPAPAR